MREISTRTTRHLTFPTLLICSSAAEGEGGEEEIYKGHLASAALVGGCGGGATASPLNLPLGYGRWRWRRRLWFRVHTLFPPSAQTV